MSQSPVDLPSIKAQGENISTTKGELLADSITKTNALDRAAHIARDLESRLVIEAKRARDAEDALSKSREALARQRAVLSIVHSQTLPVLLLQATAAMLFTVGGYVLSDPTVRPFGWLTVACGGAVLVGAGWAQLARSRKGDADP